MSKVCVPPQQHCVGDVRLNRVRTEHVLSASARVQITMHVVGGGTRSVWVICGWADVVWAGGSVLNATSRTQRVFSTQLGSALIGF